ncbi:MAG: hypothetical protein GXP29_01355 [Planctomycetes bacterium]|nr:hypothetical protein [Planctomycetota bacterium]
MNVVRAHAANAVVHWRPRQTFGSLYRQFKVYASTTGHTQLDAGATRYNLRNMAICTGLFAFGFLHPAMWLASVAAIIYFFVYNYHARCRKVAAQCNSSTAYLLALLVHWVVVAGDAAGYVRASWQRFRRRQWYRVMLNQYLDTERPGDAVPA